MDNEHRIYLFDGQTFLTVPESAWLNEIKLNPFGITVAKSAEEPFLSKAWIKVRQAQDPKTHASETEWLCQETNVRMVVSVDQNGQLSVNGKALGTTMSGETFKALEKTVNHEAGKWFMKTMPDGTRQLMHIPHDKHWDPNGFEPGKDARKPSAISAPVAKSDFLSNGQDVLSQLVNKYDLPILNCANTVEDVIRNCNAMLQLLEKEQNPTERARLAGLIENHLQLGERLSKK